MLNDKSISHEKTKVVLEKGENSKDVSNKTSTDVSISNLIEDGQENLTDKLKKAGVIEKVSRGVYIIKHSFEDEMYCLQCRYKRAISVIQYAYLIKKRILSRIND